MSKYSVEFLITQKIDAHTEEEAIELADKELIQIGLTEHFISYYAQAKAKLTEWEYLHPNQTDLTDFQKVNKQLSSIAQAELEEELKPSCTFCHNSNPAGCSMCVDLRDLVNVE